MTMGRKEEKAEQTSPAKLGETQQTAGLQMDRLEWMR